MGAQRAEDLDIAGHLADHIFTLVRTDPDAPKHKGISFILVDMRQPGIEVRPIKMITGESEFNEVFYTDATAPKDEVVGGVNNGWAVAMTLLGYERGEAAATVPIRYQAELDRLLVLAKESGAIDDPNIRQRLAWCYSKVQIMRYNGMRTLTKFLHGHQPGPDAAISKLYWSEYHKVVTELSLDILGPYAMTPTGRRPVDRVPDRRRRRAQQLVELGRHVPQRARRHDLRRLVADPAQHHRRDGPRPAEGAQAGRHEGRGHSLKPWAVRALHSVGRSPSATVVDGCASVPRVVAAPMVGTPTVPADPSRRLRPFPARDPIWLRQPSHRGRRCAELPLMVQTPPIAGFLIPVAASGNSLAPDGRHR